MNLNKIKFFLLVVFIVAFSSPLAVGAEPAQQKSYNYESINADIRLNEDSTFDVDESQTINFTGNYHFAYREIPFNKIGAISDIQVFEEDGTPLVYSKKQLNKDEPSSWGKYTYYKQNNFQYIKWYFDLKNTQHTWTIKYKIHGGITFYKPHDSFYWNIFTDYQVPVKKSEVKVTLPEKTDDENIEIYAYRTNSAIEINKLKDDGVNKFESAEFAPKEAFTVDVIFPKGIIEKSAYWKDLWKLKYGYIIAGFMMFTWAITYFLFWLFREKLQKGRGTIIPEYAPPKNLRPAMAEVITTEKITPRGLSATVVDLAIRGYLKIEEDVGENNFFAKIKRFFKSIDYKLIKIKEFDNDTNLEDYEKKYLSILFGYGSDFSTKELRKHPSEAQKFSKKILKLEEEICKETESDTNAFVVGPSAQKKMSKMLAIIFFMILPFGIAIFGSSGFEFSQLGIALTATLLVSVGMFFTIRYAARLSKEGILLKEEWLGFKTYLEVAERYRMQNLTPEIFEKYLPYAMVFGIEKKWAKAFEVMQLQAPVWFVGSNYGFSGSNSGMGASFSPTAFSASFSSSFTSSFSSSGAGGGGGGGGAGGGGGGGGGGAG